MSYLSNNLVCTYGPKSQITHLEQPVRQFTNCTQLVTSQNNIMQYGHLHNSNVCMRERCLMPHKHNRSYWVKVLSDLILGKGARGGKSAKEVMVSKQQTIQTRLLKKI